MQIIYYQINEPQFSLLGGKKKGTEESTLLISIFLEGLKYPWVVYVFMCFYIWTQVYF